MGTDTGGVSARRYLLGWAALAVATVVVTAGTVVVVRQAIGGGDLVNALSQGEVRSQYAAAGAPTPSRLAAGSKPARPSQASQTPPPRHTASSGASRPHSSSGSTTAAHHSGGTSSSTQGSAPAPTQPPTSGGSMTLVLTSSGGSVVARCSSSSPTATVYLVSWSPAQDYRVDDVQRGPAQEASIHLESGQDEVSVTYICSATGPVQRVQHDHGSGGPDN